MGAEGCHDSDTTTMSMLFLCCFYMGVLFLVGFQGGKKETTPLCAYKTHTLILSSSLGHSACSEWPARRTCRGKPEVAAVAVVGSLSAGSCRLAGWGNGKFKCIMVSCHGQVVLIAEMTVSVEPSVAARCCDPSFAW